MFGSWVFIIKHKSSKCRHCRTILEPENHHINSLTKGANGLFLGDVPFSWVCNKVCFTIILGLTKKFFFWGGDCFLFFLGFLSTSSFGWPFFWRLLEVLMLLFSLQSKKVSRTQKLLIFEVGFPTHSKD